MRYKFFILSFIAVLNCSYFNTAIAQNNNTVKELFNNYERSGTVSGKVYSLHKLIDYYYAFSNERKADSLREVQLTIAEESADQALQLFTLFPRYYNSFNTNSSQPRFNKELGFLKRALEYAKAIGKKDYEALAFANISAVYRISGQLDQALKNADIAFSTAISSGNDSVKVITTLEAGNVFLWKKNMLMAFHKFSNAYEIANNLHNSNLLSNVYYSFSMLYFRLDSYEQAKAFSLKSVALNAATGNHEDLIRDYNLIGKFVDFVPAKYYLNRAAILADSIKNPVLKLMSDQTLFILYMIHDNGNTFNFLKSHPDVEEALFGLGDYYHDWIIGEIFLYSKNYDSAYKYFKRAEPGYGINSEFPGRIYFLAELAQCCKELKLYNEAIKNYTTVLELSNVTLKTIEKSSSLLALKQIYFATGDFKLAYQYADSHTLLQDSVNQLKKEKDVALLEIDNENKRIQKENELAQKALQRKHDAQYMLITITVAVAFVLLIFLGFFTVSTGTIKVLGFFAFIFLFELITLLLDTWIHHLTHGEPGKIWLIKIFIISLMLPFHHWLEHNIIQYLTSRKLITVGQYFNVREWVKKFKRKKTPVVLPIEADVVIEKNETVD